MAKALDDSHSIYGIQSPQMAALDLHGLNLHALCTACVSKMVKIQPSSFHRLGGWSLGGILPFEISHLLEQQGHRVQWLALFDPFGEGIECNSLQKDLLEGSWDFCQQFRDPEDFLRSILELPNATINSASESDVASTVKAARTDAFVKQSIFEYFYSIKMAQQLMDEFVPETLQAPIHTFWAEESQDHYDLKVWQGFTADSRHSTIHIVPGRHEKFLSEPIRMQSRGC